jgi:hypothetical protein
MAIQTWEQVVNAYTFSATNTGNLLEKSTAITAISPGGEVAGQAFSIPPQVWEVGQLIRIVAGGVYSTAAAEVSFSLVPYWLTGAQKVVTEGKPLLPSGQYIFKTPAVAKKKVGWRWESTSRVTTIGEKGKLITNGLVHMSAAAYLPGSAFAIPSAESTGLGESEEWNLALEGRLVFTVKMGTESAEDSIQQTVWTVEILN